MAHINFQTGLRFEEEWTKEDPLLQRNQRFNRYRFLIDCYSGILRIQILYTNKRIASDLNYRKLDW